MNMEPYRPFFTADYLMGPNALKLLQELIAAAPDALSGYVLDLGGDERRRPVVRLALATSLLCALIGVITAGAWYLRRAVRRAREEADALVEMLRRNVENQEVAHV